MVENDLKIQGLKIELQELTESDLHARAENLLSLDVDINPLNGFNQSDIEKSMERSQLYQSYFARAENDIEHISCNESVTEDCLLPQDFYANNDFIYLSGLSSKNGVPKAWRGAKKVAVLLNKMFGGSAKVVNPMPRWLMPKVGICTFITCKIGIFKYPIRAPLPVKNHVYGNIQIILLTYIA